MRSNVLHNPHGFFIDYNCVTGHEETFLEVSNNRLKVAKALGFSQISLLKQIHSDIIHLISDYYDVEPQGDALITQTPGILIGVLTADCVPVLLEGSNTIAAVHAGWRGIQANIIEKTIAVMKSLGENKIRAALGPCIWQQSYEVDTDVKEQFKDQDDFFLPLGDKYLFDLPGIALHQLRQSDIKIIASSPLNTYGATYSYRYYTHNRETSRMGNFISAIGIPK